LNESTLLPNTSFPALIAEALAPNLRHFRLTSNPTLYLDFVSYPDLEPTIRTFQSRLKPTTFGSLEFTTTASKISLFSNDFVLCALPFMPRNYLNGKTTQRTSTPLLASLHHITEYVSSNNSKNIESIMNITDLQIGALRMSRQSFVTDRALRSAVIEKWGEKGWREHIFLMDWEVGLLAAGFLTRWSIVIRK